MANRLSTKVSEWIKANQGKHFCACGCGGEIRLISQHFYCGIPKYLNGHWQGRGLSLEDRFWEKVVKRGACWEFLSSPTPDGYGGFWVGHTTVRAHRFSYELHCGPIPDGLHVLHECDNPPCINPVHLFLGTNTDNVNDCLAKGRLNSRVGEKNPRAKLTAEAVAEIRALHGVLTWREISVRYGVSRATVFAIWAGMTWQHLLSSSV